MKNILELVSRNWKSGIAVALVSIPLSISLSLAGGGTPQMGIITAIWAGLIASLLGGSNYNIVGPTGALSGILASYALLHGIATLPLLAILTGIIILVVFLLRLERFIILIPASTIHGFTLGVAFIIGLNQLNGALGITPHEVHETFIANLFESIEVIGSLNLIVTAIFLVGVTALFYLKSAFPKFPNVIFVALIGVGLGLLSDQGVLPFTLPTILTKYGAIPSAIFSFSTFSSDVISNINKSLLLTALAVSVVAILETLISAKIADGMTRTRFNERKEIFGLAIANIGSGLLGGIPATAALARTSLNISTGATNKMSATISSIAVAIISVIFISYFQYLPLCMVAAILVYVAARMVTAEHFKELYHYDRRSFYLALFVAFITVVWEPIIAIGIGTIISLLLFVNDLATANAEVNINNHKNKLLNRVSAGELASIKNHGATIVYRIAGEFVYINSQSHRTYLETINSKTKRVVISMRNLYYIDVDGLNCLGEIIETLKLQGKKVAITSINQHIEPLLNKSKWFIKFKKEGFVYQSTPDALKNLKI